jgi:hypothetical protein
MLAAKNILLSVEVTLFILLAHLILYGFFAAGYRLNALSFSPLLSLPLFLFIVLFYLLFPCVAFTSDWETASEQAFDGIHSAFLLFLLSFCWIVPSACSISTCWHTHLNMLLRLLLFLVLAVFSACSFLPEGCVAFASDWTMALKQVFVGIRSASLLSLFFYFSSSFSLLALSLCRFTWMFDLFELAWGLRDADEHGADLETQRMIRLATT